MDFVLASGSPRRFEILTGLGIDFEVYKSEVEGFYDKEIITPHDYAMDLSRVKAVDIAKRLSDRDNTIIIGADTIVVKDNKIMGKPKTIEDARDMLQSLSGSGHKVITGITIVHIPSMREISDYEETQVYFKKINEKELNAYLNSGEYVDKAGAYGIQGLGSLFVRRIEGCYFNVVGLPIFKLNELLGNFDFSILS